MQSSTPTPSSTPGSPFGFIATLTTTHLILIAVLAAIVVLGMIYGARMKRLRKAARHQETQRIDAYDAEHPGGALARSAQPATPSEPVTTSVGQEEQRPVVAAPPTPPADPVDQQVPAASAAGSAAPASTDRGSSADGPVTQLKGLGPKVAARLAELGITSVGQIAALDDDAADTLDAKLGAFQGRIARDRWVEQARFLAAGDRAGFEAVFGRL